MTSTNACLVTCSKADPSGPRSSMGGTTRGPTTRQSMGRHELRLSSFRDPPRRSRDRHRGRETRKRERGRREPARSAPTTAGRSWSAWQAAGRSSGFRSRTGPTSATDRAGPPDGRSRALPGLIAGSSCRGTGTAGGRPRRPGRATPGSESMLVRERVPGHPVQRKPSRYCRARARRLRSRRRPKH